VLPLWWRERHGLSRMRGLGMWNCRLGWYWQRWRRRQSDQFAAVENPNPDETVFAPCCGKVQIIKELNVFGQRVGTQQRNDVEFSAPISSSRAPREYQPVAAVRLYQKMI
jgi:hypothetical protein